MIYTFKIALIGSSNPIIWRRIKVNSNISFETLHCIIQSVFDWRGEHLYAFRKMFYTDDRRRCFLCLDYKFDDEFTLSFRNYLDKSHFPNEGDYEAKDILLEDFFKKTKDTIVYEYDFGDGWEHKITLESIEEGKLLYPICVKGKGKTPPENCGGIWGYYQMLEVLKSGKPKGEYNDIKRWLKASFYEFPWDENEFDLEETNQSLIEDAQDDFDFIRPE